MTSEKKSAEIRLLVVTSDRDFGSTARSELSTAGNIEVEVAEGVTEALEFLRGGSSVDCIVSDHDLPEIDGIAFLEVIRTQEPSLPFILFTTAGNEEVASKAITAGVTEYLIKGKHTSQWDKLAALVSDAVEYVRTQETFVEVEKRAETVLDKSYDGIFVIRNGRCMYANQTGVEMVGVEGKVDIIDERIGELVDTPTEYSVEDRLADLEENPGTFDQQDGRLRQLNGGWVPVRLTATQVKWAGGSAAVLIARDLRERKVIEQDLELKEQAMDEAPVGVIIADSSEPEAPIVYANDQLSELTGYPLPTLMESGYWSLLEMGRDKSVVEELRLAAKRNESKTEVLNFTDESGTEHWHRISVAPLTHSDWDGTRIVGFHTDITTDREREEKLRRFERAVQAAGHAIYMTDANGEITYINPAFERITGFSEEEALGENPRILKSGEMSEEYYEELWEAVTDGEIWEEVVVNKDKDGELYYAEQTIAPIGGPEGDIIAYVAIQTDITERKQAEKALRAYKQSVESSKDLLGAIDADWEFLFANQTYREYHGIEDETVAGRSLESVLDTEQYETIRPSVKAAFAGERVQTEVTRDHPERGERILDVRLFPLRDEAGTVTGVGASMRDITAEREREAAIERESEYLRLMSKVNHTLVRGTDIEEVVAEVTSIIGDSSEFSCTFTYLLETTQTNVLCHQNSELTEEVVRAIHDQDYIDQVFNAGVIEIDDVTEDPFNQHEAPQPPHPGLAVVIGNEDDRFGVLTVHLAPGAEITDHAIAVLETIGADIGYFITNQLLRAEHKSFTEIVERIDDPVMLQNRDGTFRVLNEAVENLSGMDRSELLGRDESAFMDDESAQTVQEMKSRVLESERDVSYKLTVTFPDGRERTFSTARYPYYDDTGRLDGTIAICRDITDLEEHQRQYRVLDRVLRHNVNNNMNVIQGYAEMIRSQAGGELSQHAAKIAQNGRKLLDIAHKQRKITEFLTEPGQVERIEVSSMLDTVARRVESSYPGAEIALTIPAEVSVRAQKAIEEAVEELVVNSIVHSEQTHPKPSVQVIEDPNSVRIRVADENRPIDEMNREVLIGSPELETLRHGSGLGLWLVKLIVDHSDGTIDYERTETGKNVVTIELPRP